MQDTHNMPIQPDRPPQGTGPVLQRPPARPGLRIGAVLAGLLALVLAFSAGLVSGCQVGQSSATATSSSAGTAIPPLTGNNIESVREAVVAKVRPSVVQINVTSQQGAKLGSGVIIDSRGYIVTNNHVITGGQTIVVEIFNGSTLPAQIVGTAPSDDLAVLKVNSSRVKLAVATIGDSSKLKVGQDVLAIGNPLGITQTVTSGIISALGRSVNEQNGAIIPNAIQTDAPINPGNSGGALVDMQGNLIGIPTLTAIDPMFNTPANGVGFAIPSNRVQFIATQIIQTGKVSHSGRAALGVRITDVSPTLAAQNNLAVDHGAFVVNVVSGSPAASAGLQSGDVIVQIGNSQVNDVQSLSDILVNSSPGQTAALKVYRGSQQLTINVTLGELPAGG